MIIVIIKFVIEAIRLREIRTLHLNTEITELLSQNKIVAGYDALVKNRVIGAY